MMDKKGAGSWLRSERTSTALGMVGKWNTGSEWIGLTLRSMEHGSLLIKETPEKLNGLRNATTDIIHSFIAQWTIFHCPKY